MNTTSEDTRRYAEDSLDAVQARVDRARNQMRDAAARSAEQLRDWRDGMRDQMDRAGERTVGYVKDEPVKSLAMAAGIGALIALAIAAIARNRY